MFGLGLVFEYAIVIFIFVIAWSQVNIGLIVFIRVANQLEQLHLEMLKTQTNLVFNLLYNLWARDEDDNSNFVKTVIKADSYISTWVVCVIGLFLSLLPVASILRNFRTAVRREADVEAFLWIVVFLIILIIAFRSTSPIYQMWKKTC